MVKRAFLLTVFGITTLLAAAAAEAFPQETQATEGHPIDRWLVTPGLSTANVRETVERLAMYPPLFPDRDLEVAGVRWALERVDADGPESASVTFPPAVAGGHRLLHSYLRTDRDRTVVLAWRASQCGRVELWLNGQALVPLGRGEPGPAERRPEARTPVRLATGWNSLLAAVESEGCPGELAAWLLSAEGVEPGAADPADIRIQASRPPGMHRNYPAAWVTIAEQVRPGPLAWPAETRELTATVILELVSWGRDPAQPLPEPTPEEEEVEEVDPFEERDPIPEDPHPPVDEVDPDEEPDPAEDEPEEAPEDEPEKELSPAERVEAGWAEIRERLAPPPPPRAPAANTVLVEGRAGGARIRTPVDTPVPAEPVTFAVPLTFRELQRATAADGVSLDVRWARERWRDTRSVEAAAADARLREPIPLTGWVAAAEPDRRAQPAPGLPAAAGEPRSGRWQVPAALSGQSLELLTDGAPGRYRVNGQEVAEADAGRDGPGARIPLCDPCREGATLLIQVEATGEWNEPPRAVVVEGAARQEAR